MISDIRDIILILSATGLIACELLIDKGVIKSKPKNKRKKASSKRRK